MATPEPFEDEVADIRRSRARSDGFKFDAAEIVDRIRTFHREDDNAWGDDIAMRLQRYAKYRQWSGGGSSAWANASDTPFPDMVIDSLRMQDMIHDAVMSSRPVITSESLVREDQDKQDAVDDLIDFQIFEDDKGEVAIGEMAETFVNDGVSTVFVPCVAVMRDPLAQDLH